MWNTTRPPDDPQIDVRNMCSFGIEPAKKKKKNIEQQEVATGFQQNTNKTR